MAQEHDRLSLFDRWAAKYDQAVRGAAGFPFAGYDRVLGAVFRAARVQQGMRVLDVGVGTGNLARLFLDAGCQVWGVDVSTKVLAQARQRLPGVRLVRADLTRRLPEEVRVGFDRIVSTYFFHEFPMTEKVALITRLTDHALNPGGFLVVGDVGFPDRKAFELAREHWAREWDEEAFYWVGDEAVRALEQAGFDAVYTQVTVSAGVLVIRPGRPSASD